MEKRRSADIGVTPMPGDESHVLFGAVYMSSTYKSINALKLSSFKMDCPL